MRLLTVVHCTILGLLINSACVFADSGWKVLSVSDYSFHVYIAGFNNAGTGITAGYAGEVHYTTDGGKTWPHGTNSSYCLFGLEILDAKNAWSCGNYRNVRISHDSGVNWSELASFGGSEPNQCRYLSFSDASNGWIGSQELLANTSDGGKSWTAIKLPEGILEIEAISLLNPKTGYLFDSGGSLFTTTDGAKTWNKKSVNLNGRSLMPLERQPYSALRFTSEKDAVLIYLDKTLKWIIARTSDAGNSWKEERVPEAVSLGFGSVFISHDARYITIQNINNKIYALSDL